MNVMPEVVEARATAEVLRATARAVRPGPGTLWLRLYRAADALDGMVTLAVRCQERIEQLEQELRAVCGGGQ